MFEAAEIREWRGHDVVGGDGHGLSGGSDDCAVPARQVAVGEMISRGLLPFSGPASPILAPGPSTKKNSGSCTVPPHSGLSCQGPEQLNPHYPGRRTGVHQRNQPAASIGRGRDHGHITASVGWQAAAHRPRTGPASSRAPPRPSGVRPNPCPAAQAQWACSWLQAAIFVLLAAGLTVMMVTEPTKVFLMLSTAVTVALVAAGTGASTLWFLSVLRWG